MRKTIVYVDGFNLYYRALKGTRHKWLDLHAVCKAVLPGSCDIVRINYYTARVSGRVSKSSPRDQNTYLKALGTVPCIAVHFGNFQVTEASMYLCQPPSFKPPSVVQAEPTPRFAQVSKTEEKGSDVNLGVHLVRDAFIGAFEQAAIITNDTDLTEPLRIVTQEAQLPVTLLSPVRKPADSLRKLATHVRHLEGHLGRCHFPGLMTDAKGRPLERPEGW